jgi:hypothetical protein
VVRAAVARAAVVVVRAAALTISSTLFLDRSISYWVPLKVKRAVSSASPP